MYRLKRENATSTDGKATVQADKDKFKINIDGKSTQATRDGKNKFNLAYIRNAPSVFTVTDTGVNLTNAWVTDVYTFENIAKTFKSNTTYTMRVKAKVVSRPSNILYHNNAIFYFYRQRTSTLGAVGVNVLLMSDKETVALGTEKEYITTFTTPEDMTDVRFISYTFNGNNDGSTTNSAQGEIDVSEIMLVEGTYTAENFPDFELYGVSPSPDYPSEIKSIGDDVNLLQNNATTTTVNGITFTVNSDGTVIANGTATAQATIDIGRNLENIFNGKYIMSGSPKGSSSSTYYMNLFKTENGTVTSIGAEYGNGITTEQENDCYLWTRIVIVSGQTVNNLVFKPKLQKGTVATPYSEYGKGTVTIEQRGKNLYNKNGNLNYPSTFNQNKTTLLDNGTIKTTANYSQWASTGYQLKNIIQNTDYTLSGRLVSSTGAGSSVIASVIVYGYSNNKWNGIGIGHLTKVGVFNIKFNSGTYSDFFISLNANGTIGTSYEAIFENIQVEKNSEATDYEPYFSKDYVIPLSAPLRSLPNGTKDTIEEDGIHRRVVSVVLDGSETIYDSGSNNTTHHFTIKPVNKKNGQTNMMSNMFKQSIDATEVYTIVGNNSNTNITFKMPVAEFSTVKSFKSFLSEQYANGTPITVNYELSEEVVEPFTDEQQAVLNSMVTEKGTNIFNINEDTRITLNYTPEFTDEIKHAFKYGITRGYLEVLDGSGLIINEDNYLQSIDFDDERYVDGEGIIGTTVAKSLEGKFINVDSEFSVENKELQAYIGAELDNGTTKYIDLGTFIVQKPDNNNVTDNTSFNALDYMVKFNKKFEDRLDYSKRNITIADLLQDICDQCEVICGTIIFRNSTFIIENNQFINNESCRDVLKAIAQMAFSWARINQDNELVLDFNLSDKITETINNDEYYELKDNEQYGPVNTIILRNSQVEGENYTIIDPNKLSTDKTCELVINDNPFAYTQAKRKELIQAGSALFGFKYIPLTTKTIGSVYLNCQDKLRVKNMQDKNLDTYIFNNKISYDGRITDTKETSAMTETETKYQFTDTMANKLNAKMARTEIVVDKANQQITAVVEQIGDRSEKTTTITADIDGLNSKVEEIVVLTNTISGNRINLENCAYSEIIELVITGDVEVLTLADDAIGHCGTVPMPNLAPLGTLAPSKPQKQSKAVYVSDNTYLLDTTLIHIKPDNTTVKISLPDFILRTLGETKDEFHIKDGKAYVIQKIELDAAGYKYILDEPKTIELGTIELILEEGTNTLYMEGFPNATLAATYMIKNELSDNFATKVELSTSIKQTSTEIMSEVNKKVDEEEFGTKIVQDYQSVQIAWNKIDELIQFIDGKLKILNQSKQTLMTLDKLGQHFFSNNNEFGNMGINVVDNKKYISFSVDGEYGSSTNNGMAWGVTTKSDNKFFPILFIENFNVAQKDADDYGGQLVLTACDLVLQGIGAGVISGNVKMYGNDLTNGLIFEDTASGEALLEIIPDGSSLYTYPRIRFLDGAIDFFRNQAGSNSFKIGNSLFTDEDNLIIGNDNNNGSITVHGNVYANNISSDKRIKENIQDSNTNALEIIKKIKHKQFYKKDDKKHYDIGYIAQDMEEIDPNFVIKREKTEYEEERYYINELPIIATLSKAIQEQQEIIEQLQNKINELEEKIND